MQFDSRPEYKTKIEQKPFRNERFFCLKPTYPIPENRVKKIPMFQLPPKRALVIYTISPNIIIFRYAAPRI